ncbi:hypothetical protein [Paraliomyxa miuraensis]|uniref:hypothetical protein n=1 Tax=Paraliomyxa miuraensis TaxID=376150 RepID=UPI00225C3753|nr:hypothetical protein [Paraliomyxa miuraensis]MCX4239529.1 hypothetical protein [Paraliomyxa miuraensis]
MRNRTRALAGVCGVWLVLGGASGALAGPPEDAAGEGAAGEAPDEGVAEAKAPPPTSTVSVPAVRREMENDMAKIGDLAAEAKRDADLVRAACVIDKQERAQGVMELATGEMLIIRDEGSSAEARSFAVEKLQAASDRLGDLVEQAKECIGDKAPEESDDVTNNEVDEDPTIPVADPTVGGSPDGTKPNRVPPPIDDASPPSVGSPSM